ncbi:N-acetyltransferase family protein [archaeon]|nr:MAG: N-acetyltransferase family protein [archaeon]
MSRIREATLDDAVAICSIYNYYIEHTVVTFEEELLEVEEMRSRIVQIMEKFPYIVSVNDADEVIGYAYANTWRARKAYRFSAEVTVYLKQGQDGQGVGSMLYTHLIQTLKQSGYHLLIGGIALPNDASVKLHERMGFTKAGHFKDAGFKFERWVDVGFWQLVLSDTHSSSTNSV